jgi:hypothetical protein
VFCDAVDVLIVIGLIEANNAEPFCTTFINAEPVTSTATISTGTTVIETLTTQTITTVVE